MCTKVSYPSKRSAQQAAYAIKCKGKISPRSWLREYYCKNCETWHLTHMTSEEWFHNLK